MSTSYKIQKVQDWRGGDRVCMMFFVGSWYCISGWIITLELMSTATLIFHLVYGRKDNPPKDSLVPRLSCVGREKEPGIHCLRMLSSPRISGDLEISIK